ncbi:MAG: glutamyl-tRNA reductase [Deltaproteobacteria bacterium]|nr:glutamyl-tRNA reductase [Deltaproteobacteria bacterium]
MIVVGLSHRTAPIDVRERLAIEPHKLESVLQRVVALKPVAEVVALSTCNRVEIYAAANSSACENEALRAVTRLVSDVGGSEVVPHLARATGRDALAHLFRVAASLDSLVVGEPQILGQLKDGITSAQEAGTMGAELSVAMRNALHVAKKVRTETAIGSGQVSVPSVAVDLARHIFADLSGHATLLVGAGEMAETAAKLLARAGAKLQVVNRSNERGAQLARLVGGRARPWEELDEAVVEADIVIASTASRGHIIRYDQLRRAKRKRRHRRLFLIDIALPRDIEPRVHDLDNVFLYDIDDLSHVVAKSRGGRAAEARRAEAIVVDEVRRYERRRSQERMKPVIVAMRERTRQVLEAELDRSCRGKLKHLPDQDRQAIHKMLDAATNKLLHGPTQRLRGFACDHRGVTAKRVLSELFDLDQLIREAKQADQAEDEPEIEVQEHEEKGAVAEPGDDDRAAEAASG